MKNVLQDVIAYVLLLLARAASPALGRWFSRIATRLAGDVPDLSAHWEARFEWPTATGKTRPSGLDITLTQYGRFVRGAGHVQGEPGDPFVYSGTIRRNVLYGTFKRRDAHVLAGTGAFTLKINSSSKRMDGFAVWYASRHDQVHSSPYRWERR